MTAENLKEILLNVKPGDYNKIMEYQITQEDIKDFYNLYSEFVSLENDYQQKILGRKEIAKDLPEQATQFRFKYKCDNTNCPYRESCKYKSFIGIYKK